MRQVPFIKMHGLGNDFVIIDQRIISYDLSTSIIRMLADRHLGIGCDQLIVLELSELADVRMVIMNQDGTQAEACGNATRCVAAFMLQGVGTTVLTIETKAGILKANLLTNGGVLVNMGMPNMDWQMIPLVEPMNPLQIAIDIEGLSLPAAVSIGNPHLVFFTNDLASIDLAKIGPELECHPFFPARINVNIAQIIGEDQISLRVWERGVGETAACGSGACASFYIAYLKELVSKSATVNLPGGKLQIELNQDGQLLMTGPSKLSFTGVFYI